MDNYLFRKRKELVKRISNTGIPKKMILEAIDATGYEYNKVCDYLGL